MSLLADKQLRESYSKADGTRAFTGAVSYNAAIPLSADANLVHKKYVDDMVATAVANLRIVDQFTPEVVARGTSFVQLLSQVANPASEVAMFVNGQKQSHGKDFTVTNRTVAWALTADWDIDADDAVELVYSK